ncbi:hypothetical protein ACFL6P_03140 [Candidatus Latescibacterota bacterium]
MKKNTTEKKTILDHIDNIIVPGEVFNAPANEYWALVCLRRGLFSIYGSVLSMEKTVIDQLNSKKMKGAFLYGNSPEFKDIPLDILTCFYHWYAVSACQYVRTIGAIGYLHDNTRCLPPEYVKSVVPEVLTFRDKVAAHFAWTTKHSQDNEAERIASIIPQVSFNEDAFFVGMMTMRMSTNGKSSDSSGIKPWSITKTHKKLCERYWPETLN